jgi:hypothetical protein
MQRDWKIRADENLAFANMVRNLDAGQVAEIDDEGRAIYYKVTDPIHHFVRMMEDLFRRPRESDSAFHNRQQRSAQRKNGRFLKKYPEHTRGMIDRWSVPPKPRAKQAKNGKPTEPRSTLDDVYTRIENMQLEKRRAKKAKQVAKKSSKKKKVMASKATRVIKKRAFRGPSVKDVERSMIYAAAFQAAAKKTLPKLKRNAKRVKIENLGDLIHLPRWYKAAKIASKSERKATIDASKYVKKFNRMSYVDQINDAKYMQKMFGKPLDADALTPAEADILLSANPTATRRKTAVKKAVKQRKAA